MSIKGASRSAVDLEGSPERMRAYPLAGERWSYSRFSSNSNRRRETRRRSNVISSSSRAAEVRGQGLSRSEFPATRIRPCN